jgi:Flp pilus assembly pilin Flp
VRPFPDGAGKWQASVRGGTQPRKRSVELDHTPRGLYVSLSNLVKDERGQDMVEYALLAGFIAVAAGATMPPIANSLSTIFSKMASLTSVASTQ